MKLLSAVLPQDLVFFLGRIEACNVEYLIEINLAVSGVSSHMELVDANGKLRNSSTVRIARIQPIDSTECRPGSHECDTYPLLRKGGEPFTCFFALYH
ncbi:hypothetical protein FEP63_05178 [Burkholderia multivorans]|nr:hypothetical protein [Burkholderia multivorans]